MIPGLGSSILVKNNIDIWPPKLNYFLWNYKEWEQSIIVNNNDGELIYDKLVKPLQFGDKKSLDFHTNIPYIIKKNFYDNILHEYSDIFPIPYDLRLLHSNDYRINFYQQLEKYIESFNKPSILLTHSTGGLLCHYFLLTKSIKWKNKYIKSIINVSVPFGGTIRSLNECILNTKINLIINKKIIKTIGGVIINFPNIKYTDKILIVNNKIVDDYFSYFKLTDIKKLYDNNEDFINSFSKSNNIKTHIVYSSNIKTMESININNNKWIFNNGLGDGIVSLKSLLVPKYWNNKDITFTNIPNTDHSSILCSQKLIEIINSM